MRSPEQVSPAVQATIDRLQSQGWGYVDNCASNARGDVSVPQGYEVSFVPNPDDSQENLVFTRFVAPTKAA